MRFGSRGLRMHRVLAAHPGAHATTTAHGHNGPRADGGRMAQPLGALQHLGGNRAFASLIASGATQRTPRFDTPGDALERELGAGHALDPGLRHWFEPRLGHPLGDVRVHTGEHAARAAASVSARAFTLGRHVVFGNAEYAPHTPAGRRLLAHELVHVVQQRGAADPMIQRELVYGDGYPNRFRSDRAEVGCVTSRDCKWSPSSEDFRAGARSSGGGSAAASFSALLDHIAAAAPGSIHELGLIGHANSTNFGLSGTITANDVWFTAEGLINTETLARESARIAALRDRFAADAVITLYGCNAGAGQGLLDAISNAFHVCVKGFSNEIVFCIQWRTNRARTIFDRGRTWIDDPLELQRPEDVGCANFHANVRDNIPDRQSCVGVPVAAPTSAPPAASGPRRFGLEMRAGAAASDDAWRAALGVGVRYQLRSDQAIIWNPIVGGHLVYLPTSGDQVSHVAAVIAELGLRIQQPLEGFYFDVRAGGYVGIEVPGAASAEETRAVGGFTPAAGLGYHSERFSLGAEGRVLVGDNPTHFIVVGAGAWHW